MEYKHVKAELARLCTKGVDNTADDQDRERLSTIFELLNIKNTKKSKESYLCSILDYVIKLSTTTLGKSFKDEIYMFFFMLMKRTVKLDVANKLRAYKHMRYIQSNCDLFNDLYLEYANLDLLDVNGKVFRNYILEKIVERILTEKERVKQLKRICEIMDSDKNGFAKNLCDISCEPENKHPNEEYVKDEHKIILILFYTYRWLEGIQIDLNNIKSAKEVEDIDDTILSRIFDGFSQMHAIEFSKGKNSKVIFDLFKTKSYENIIYSIYQRLFNFYVWKNKKKLATAKILRAFDRAMQHTIYLKLRGTPDVFLNVFRQINPQYLTLELEKTKSSQILSDTIAHFDMFTAKKDILCIFNTFLFGLECNLDESVVAKFSGKIQKNLELFAEAFVSLHECSKHEIKNKLNLLKLNINIRNYKDNVDVLHMATYFERPLFDIVEFVSLIVDNESIIRSKPDYFRCKYILCLIYKHRETISAGLMNRLKEVLKCNISNREHIKSIGRLYNYSFDTLESKKHNPLIQGAIGAPSYKFNTANLNNLEHVGVLLNMHYTITAQHLEVCSAILRDQENHVLKMLVFETIIDLIEGNKCTREVNKFITNNCTLLCDLFMKYYEQIGIIFLYGLRNKLVVPQNVIKYLIAVFNNQYVLRNYYDTALNSANESLEIIYTDLISDIISITKNNTVEQAVLDQLIGDKTSNLILSNLYTFENREECVFRKKRELRIKEEKLFIYLLLKSIKYYNKKDREQFLSEIELKVETTELKELVEQIRKKYNRGGRKEIEIDILL